VASVTAKWLYRHSSQSVALGIVRFAEELPADSPFAPREALAGKDARTLARELLGMTQDDLSPAFRASPMKRAKLRGLKRNAAVVLGNVGTLADAAVLEQALATPSRSCASTRRGRSRASTRGSSARDAYRRGGAVPRAVPRVVPAPDPHGLAATPKGARGLMAFAACCHVALTRGVPARRAWPHAAWTTTPYIRRRRPRLLRPRPMPRPVCRSRFASRAAPFFALATGALVELAPAASVHAQPRRAAAPAAPAPAAGAPALWVPRSVRRAYANGTRSPDGRPGPRYWQNRARYEIALDVTPAARTVRGRETVTYANASPDTLRAVVLKLLLNVHKPGAVRLAPAAPDYLTAGLQIDSVLVNGAPVAWADDAASGTVRRLPLPSPLLPRDSVRLTFAWHYALASAPGREGMLDSTTAFLAYFYPRVAVYDDVEGWDTMPFTDAQEFYSDFNDYDVTLRVPARALVWGTGTLANPEAVLRPEALRRYRASLTADTTIHVATRAELAAGQVTAGAATPGATNVWRFTARGVPDVAFAVGDHYVWDAASVVVDSATRRRASVQAAYHDTAPDFPHMVRFGRDGLAWLSRQWPGVPYPYEQATVVQGFADMEYPMMVNDNSVADTAFARFVVEHELAHSWFPFHLGTNETRYGFMDEGWATAFEYLLNQVRRGPAQAAALFREFRVAEWIADPRRSRTCPSSSPATPSPAPRSTTTSTARRHSAIWPRRSCSATPRSAPGSTRSSSAGGVGTRSRGTSSRR
jgi:hypothetical protein